MRKSIGFLASELSAEPSSGCSRCSPFPHGDHEQTLRQCTVSSYKIRLWPRVPRSLPVRQAPRMVGLLIARVTETRPGGWTITNSIPGSCGFKTGPWLPGTRLSRPLRILERYEASRGSICVKARWCVRLRGAMMIRVDTQVERCATPADAARM